MPVEYHAHFTPSLMSAEALEATFVQRHDLARRLLDLVRDSTRTRSEHHHLLVGPRGIGKTHLVSLLYHRVKADEEFRDHVKIAWLREEEWGVSSFLDLLVRILRALDLEYQDAVLSAGIENLYELDIHAAKKEARRLLREWLTGQTLLLLVENLDDLFAGLGGPGQKQFRAHLQEEEGVTSIVATTPALFQGVARRVSPFYGFFRIHHLDRLSIEQAVQLVSRSLKFRGQDELAEGVDSGQGRARIRVIHHLAGGNHRVYAIFGQFLTVDSFDNLIALVLRTLDDLTPYYQAKVAQLAPLQRKIVETLCDRRGAMPVHQIAKLCFTSPQTISRQLTTLSQLGYVARESYGRQSYYELSEPLMRLSVEVKKSRGEPIRLLVDFLRVWFSSSVLEDALTFQSHQMLCHSISGESKEALDDSIDILEHAPASVGAWMVCGDTLLCQGLFELAAACYRRAVELVPRNASLFKSFAILLYRCGRRNEALSVLQKALTGNSKDDLVGTISNNKGVALLSLGRYEQAIEALTVAIELEAKDAHLWFNRSSALIASGPQDEGIRALDEALDLLTATDDAQTGDDTAIVRNLLMSGEEPDRWQTFLDIWLDRFKEHQVLPILGHGLVHSIPTATSDWLPLERADAWLKTWLEAAQGIAELTLPLRLLKVAVEFRASSDPRVLYSLPKEEREILRPLLRIREELPEQVEHRIRKLLETPLDS
jgi:tetratricopeptide (TPR) repeat protein